MSQLIPNGTYPIRNLFSGYSLKPQDDNVKSSVVTDQDDTSDSFQWTFYCRNVQQSLYTITNKKNGLAAYVANNSPPNTKVTIDSTAQVFTIAAVPGTTGVYTIYTQDSLAYWSVDALSAKTPVTLSATNSSDHQQFIIGTFRSGLVTARYRFTDQNHKIPIKPNADSEGSSIVPAMDDGSQSFVWQLTAQGLDIFTIQNVNDTLFVSTGPQAGSDVRATLSKTSQGYTVLPVPGKTGIYTIQTIDSQKYLGVKGGFPSFVATGNAGTAAAFQWAITRA